MGYLTRQPILLLGNREAAIRYIPIRDIDYDSSCLLDQSILRHRSYFHFELFDFIWDGVCATLVDISFGTDKIHNRQRGSRCFD